ncbi:MAG: hypothetical protein ACKVT0_10890 [Planctomycetaceae bacterium]
MGIERQILLVLVLVCWIAAWWLAIRIIFGQRFGQFVFVPVIVVAFGIPILLADIAATSALSISDIEILLIWGAIPVVVDATWGTRKLFRWYHRRRVEEEGTTGM